MSTVYFALVETADGTGTAKPIWTTRDPELLRLVWRHLRKRLDPVAQMKANVNPNQAPKEAIMTLGAKVDAFQKQITEDPNVWSELHICNSTSLIDGSGCLQQTVLKEEEDGTKTVLGWKVYSVRVVDEWEEGN